MSSDDDTTEPTELDRGMVERARAAFEAMTKAMLDAGRRYEERMNAATTAALSAANVPGLVAEVEGRAEFEANTAPSEACPSCGSGSHWRVDAMCLAPEGEQPGEEREFCKCQKPPHYLHRPAPVVPDGGHVLTEYGTTSCPVEIVRAEVVDGKCSACGAVVPDSPDARSGHVHTTLDQEAVIQDVATDVMDALGFHPQDDGRDDVAAVIRRHPGLAVVGQGVTAEPQVIPRYAMLDVWQALGHEPVEFEAWRDEHGYSEAWARLCAEVRERWACDHERAAREIAKTTAATPEQALALVDALARGARTLEEAWDEGARAVREGDVCGNTECCPEPDGNPYRAAVRPTGQEQADG